MKSTTLSYIADILVDPCGKDFYRYLSFSPEFVSGIECFLSGVHIPHFNGVLHTTIEEKEVSKSCELVNQYFKSSNTPYSWWVNTAREPKIYQENSVSMVWNA